MTAGRHEVAMLREALSNGEGGFDGICLVDEGVLERRIEISNPHFSTAAPNFSPINFILIPTKTTLAPDRLNHTYFWHSGYFICIISLSNIFLEIFEGKRLIFQGVFLAVLLNGCTHETLPNAILGIQEVVINLVC